MATTFYPLPQYSVVMEDPIVHSEAHPFCPDSSCPCHSDESAQAIAERERLLWAPYRAGLLTWSEVLNTFYDRQVS